MIELYRIMSKTDVSECMLTIFWLANHGNKIAESCYKCLQVLKTPPLTGADIGRGLRGL